MLSADDPETARVSDVAGGVAANGAGDSDSIVPAIDSTGLPSTVPEMEGESDATDSAVKGGATGDGSGRFFGLAADAEAVEDAVDAADDAADAADAAP